MISSVDPERLRATPVLPECDLGVVLEALFKSPYEPLQEACPNPFTYKTVFLLAMVSAGRFSELQALVFNSAFLQFKPLGFGVTLYSSPEFMHMNQKPTQIKDPWFIPAVSTGKNEFGAPNHPVRALRYYHQFMKNHLELWKDRHRLFIPVKEINSGKELSTATISRWICIMHIALWSLMQL